MQIKPYKVCDIKPDSQLISEEISENDHHKDAQDSNVEETFEEISTNEDIQMPVGHEINDSTSLCKEEIIEYNPIETNPQDSGFEMTENDHFEDSHDSNNLNEEAFEEPTKEISTNENIAIVNETNHLSQNNDFEKNVNQLFDEEKTEEIMTREDEIEIPNNGEI